MVPMLLLLLLMEIGLGLEIMIAVELLRVVHVVDWVRVEGDLVLLRLLLRMDRCKHNAEESRDIVFNVAAQRQRHCFQHRQDSFLEYLGFLESTAYQSVGPLYHRPPTLFDLAFGQHLLISVLNPSIHEKSNICHGTILCDDITDPLGHHLFLLPADHKLVFQHQLTQPLHVSNMQDAKSDHAKNIQELTLHLESLIESQGV
jgi:hypothetical protein